MNNQLQLVICIGLVLMALGGLCFIGVGHLRGTTAPDSLIQMVATIVGGLIGYLQHPPGVQGAERAGVVNVAAGEQN